MKIRQFVVRTLLIAVGVMSFYHASAAQTTGTADELVKRVVAALESNDQQALNVLSIDQSEFKKYVWPTLPAQSGSNSSADMYYPTFQKVSQVGISEAASALAGKKWDVVKVSLESPKKKGKGYQVFGSPLITLRDNAGKEASVRLVGGLLERDGVYKVTSFYVSPSLRASK